MKSLSRRECRKSAKSEWPNTYHQRKKTVAERFWEKVDKGAECWEWTASTKPNGYGQFTANGKNHLTHKFVMEIEGHEIPDGMFVCHKCHNKLCVNPDHLYVGTPKDNCRDRDEIGRGSHKLNDEDVRRIRDMLRCGAVQRDIADWFDVDPSTISHIKSGRSRGSANHA